MIFASARRCSGVRARLAAKVYYGWVVAGCCFLAAGAMFGMTYSFSVFFDPLTGAFPVSDARLSLVFGIQTAVIYVSAAALGGLLDRAGARRILLVGTVLLAGGLIGASVSDHYLLLIVTYGVITGLGMSCVYLVAYTTVPRWFERRRGFANGIASAGLGMGLLVIAPVASTLIVRFGWRNAYRTLAVGLGLVLLIAVAFLADEPADIGADPTHEFPGQRQGKGVGTTTSGTDGDVVEVRDDESWVARFRAVHSIVLSPPFLLVVAGWIGVYATLYVLINHLVRYAASVGMRAAGVSAVSALGVTTGLARLGVGFASDRLGRTRVFVVCSTVMAGAVLALPVARTPGVLLAIAILFGVGYGGNGALLSPLVADLFGAESLGTLYGLASIAFAVSGLLAPPLASLGYGHLGVYAPVFLATGAVGLVGAGCIAAAGYLQG